MSKRHSIAWSDNPFVWVVSFCRLDDPGPLPDGARERPILFSAPMVRAVLAGKKTQTRRVVKRAGKLMTAVATIQRGRQPHPIVAKLIPELRCPYGKPGDRLWVKEAITLSPVLDNGSNYVADGRSTKATSWPWKRDTLPGIFLPRKLSRITLEVVAVRVERLQEISEEDARAEGAQFHDGHGVGHSGWRHDRNHGCVYATARRSFEVLWDSINGPKRGGAR